ncbi:MAG: hypothetical protein ABSE43_08055 [Steroidobacteraceae bacterium]|jgi:hypothetical protein
MSERESENFDLDEEFVAESEESTDDYDKLLARVDKRVRNQGKRGKAAWSRLEEVLADRKLEKDLRDIFDEEM